MNEIKIENKNKLPANAARRTAGKKNKKREEQLTKTTRKTKTPN